MYNCHLLHIFTPTTSHRHTLLMKTTFPRIHCIAPYFAYRYLILVHSFHGKSSFLLAIEKKQDEKCKERGMNIEVQMPPGKRQLLDF